jgi:hypothetical protein
MYYIMQQQHDGASLGASSEAWIDEATLVNNGVFIVEDVRALVEKLVSILVGGLYPFRFSKTLSVLI